MQHIENQTKDLTDKLLAQAYRLGYSACALKATQTLQAALTAAMPAIAAGPIVKATEYFTRAISEDAAKADIKQEFDPERFDGLS